MKSSLLHERSEGSCNPGSARASANLSFLLDSDSWLEGSSVRSLMEVSGRILQASSLVDSRTFWTFPKDIYFAKREGGLGEGKGLGIPA